ncbi:MAG: aminotransferase class I/II-fold pyridoxal phosphate-dependent enzyme [Pseudomonadales bacterium]|nr:aminotransferase class I/II-fold pyridoxal phosphate-dependent enzyme [Pseudomonadales bacterium]
MRSIDEDVVNSVVRTLREGKLFRYQEGADTPATELEAVFAGALGVKHCLALNSCTSALYVAMISSGVKPGDRVLIPAFTFIAVPSAIVQAGAEPVLVEVDENYVIDLDHLEASISDSTRYLMLSYMRGRVPDMGRVLDICSRHNIVLLEDAAHSMGVSYDGTPTGKFGLAAAFSFQSYKLLDAGEGGLLVTDNDEVAARALIHSGCYEENFKKHRFEKAMIDRLSSLANSIPTYNFRMSNLSAAALLPQVAKIQPRVQQYNTNYQALVEELSRSEHIRIPSFTDKVEPACDSLQFYVLEHVSDEKILELQSRCREIGVPLNLFGFDSFNARCFWNWKFVGEQSLPKTRALLQRTADVRLPLDMSADQLGALSKLVIETLQ